MGRMKLITIGIRQWRRWRDREGLTQSQAAARLDIEVSYLAKIEQGTRRPGRAIAARMAAMAGVDACAWDQPAPVSRAS